MCFYAPVLVKKDTAETNACAKEKIVNKLGVIFQYGMNCMMAWNKRC
jgi:hypothetical protein